MDKKRRRLLGSLLAELDAGERNRLTKRAAKLRKAALRTRKPGVPRPNLEDFLLELVDEELGMGPAGGEGAADGRIGLSQDHDAGAADLHGVVSGISAGACAVLLNGCRPGEETPATLPAELAGRQQSELAVGDRVLAQRQGDTHRIIAVLPRRTLLARADPHVPRRRRAIAANVDLVGVVVAALAPPLHPRLIDRYLVAVEQSGADPVLVVNKVDLVDETDRHELLARLQPYRSLGMPVLPCSVELVEGVREIRETLAGHTCVFVGQSGVGKSSLLNALGGKAAAPTGAVRAGDGRGRHTTTASALYELPGSIRVIDTPGIRRFSLDGGDPAAVAAGFAEFRSYAADCRFRDCTHVHEPGCAVRRAVADGAIPRSRYVSYRKLLGGDGDDPRPAEGEPAPADAGAGGQFTCAHCRRPVAPDTAGSRHRNHCPHCLHSLHLDEKPGDRAACCGGVMDPVTVWVRGRGEWALVHRCRTCGRLSSNRIAGDDNEALLLSLAVKPLSAPPFPLDGFAGRSTAGPPDRPGDGDRRDPVRECGWDGGLDPAVGQTG